MSLHKQVSKAIRILSWDRDVSARASHLADLTIQAEFENVSGSTTERKTMSTKTTFKRVALVAVAALSLGGLTAVSSSAVPYSDTLTQTSATSAATLNNPVYDTVTATFFGGAVGDTLTLTVSRTVPGTNAGVYSLTPATSDTLTVVDSNTARVVNTAANQLTTGNLVIKFTPAAVGTYTFKVTPTLSGSATANAAAVTWTITVADPAYDHSVAVISTETSTALVQTTDATTLTSLSSAAPSAVAKISVGQYSSTTAGDTTTAVSVANAQSMVIEVSGAGYLATTNTAPSLTNKLTTAAATAASTYVYLWNNGTPGVAKVTVTVGGVLVATKSYTFAGTLASYTLAAALKGNTTTAVTNVAVGESITVAVTGADSASNALSAGTIYAISSDTSIATAALVQTDTVTVTGVKAGTTTITVANASTVAAATITKTFSVTVAPAAVGTTGTVSITLDKDSYLPGEKITVNVSGKDSTGLVLADGARSLFTADKGLTSSVALTSATFDSNSVTTLAAGVASFTAYAPSYGSFTITATDVNGNAVTSPTATIVNAAADAAQAAIDAAQEATDAANAAYDAANNAMDSADAATAAAQDASDNAAAALAAVTSLSATVAKLVKSVAAIAAALAKVQKKLGA